jgi:hypothetical protein
MTDRPAIFSGPMVRALIRERDPKTMTRRAAWGKWLTVEQCVKSKQKLRIRGDDERVPAYAQRATPWQNVKPGDRIWIKETWQQTDNGILYFADADYMDSIKWRSPIHMPRRLSRITLIVSAVKIERLQDISEADAKAEGIWPAQILVNGRTIDVWFGANENACDETPVRAFELLWETINNPRGYCAEDAPLGWSANPEVVAVTFKTYRTNIDKVGTRHDQEMVA